MLRFLHRLRWTTDEPDNGLRAERAVVARAFAYLYGAGASLVLVTLALPQGEDAHPAIIVAAALAAYAVVAVLLIGFDRLPVRFLVSLPPLGTLLVSTVLIGSGAGSVAAYAMMYFWVVLAAAYFFSARITVANLVFVSAAYAAVLSITPSVETAAIKWLMASGALGVSGLLMSLLRARVGRLFGRLEHHAAQADVLAELSRQALDPGRVAGLPAAAAAAVRSSLAVDCSTVLVKPDASLAMEVVAAEGWRADIAGLVPPSPAAGGLTDLVLGSSEAVVVAEHPDLRWSEGLTSEGVVDGLLVSLRGQDAVYGLLAAWTREPRHFTAQEASFLEAVSSIVGASVERERTADRLRHQADHDELTGQPNRKHFLDQLAEALVQARKSGTRAAVLFVDIDHFKVVNDSMGHAAGDALLRAVGPRLRHAAGPDGFLARFGGDEFLLLCRGATEAEAAAAAHRLHGCLRAPFRIGGAAHRLTASIGVAVSDGADDAHTVLRNADAALSRAKLEGRDRTAVYDARMHRQALGRLRTENALRDALAEGQLRLAYQPVAELETGRILGFEALLRWSHPELGEVAPGTMIPIAEETGLIVPIGEWVVAEACAASARWRRRTGQTPTVGVNVSARQLAESTLVAHVAAVLRATGVPADGLVVEITESVLLGDSPVVAERLAELRALGVRIALDDFGTGYSSLSYLSRFPVDLLKVDRSFVSRVDQGSGDAAIVGAVLGMAGGLGLQVVAEGIETVAQAECLRAMGCRLGQGYLLGRPSFAAHAQDLLAAGGRVAVAMPAVAPSAA